MKLGKVIAGGTIVIDCGFEDEEGEAVVPNSLRWSWCDKDGEIINNREDVSIPIASEVSVVLEGDDLPNDVSIGYLLIDGVYDSTNGDDLPLRKEGYIVITKTKNDIE